MEEPRNEWWFYFLVIALLALALFGCYYLGVVRLIKPFLDLGQATPTPW